MVKPRDMREDIPEELIRLRDLFNTLYDYDCESPVVAEAYVAAQGKMLGNVCDICGNYDMFIGGPDGDMQACWEQLPLLLLLLLLILLHLELVILLSSSSSSLAASPSLAERRAAGGGGGANDTLPRRRRRRRRRSPPKVVHPRICPYCRMHYHATCSDRLGRDLVNEAAETGRSPQPNPLLLVLL
eukprot:6022761-Pyramimonas_sp.AAC.1